MTVSTKSRSTSRTRTGNSKAKSTEGQKPEATEAPSTEAAKPAKAPKAKEPTTPTYREAANFNDALKSAKGVAKGNSDLTTPLQLITHLAWKTPGGTVGWAKGTTVAVVEFANELLLEEGTALPDAMKVALSAADKGAADKPQKDAVAALGKVINGHG